MDCRVETVLNALMFRLFYKGHRNSKIPNLLNVQNMCLESSSPQIRDRTIGVTEVKGCQDWEPEGVLVSVCVCVCGSLQFSVEGRPFLLKFSSFLVAAGADTHGVVPAPRWNRPAFCGAVVTHPLTAGTAVMLGQFGSELTLAVVAGHNVLVRHPVGRTSCVFYQTWKTGRWDRTHYCDTTTS